MAPLPLSVGDVAAATRGRIVGGEPRATFDRVSIDSRSVRAGDLFIAIRGERFDGHEFIPEALIRGAAAVVVDRVPRDLPVHGAVPPAVIQVDDTTRALQRLALDVRRRSGAKVVAITGSAGKTTTKEVAAEFLSARYRVFRNKGNLNNHIGLPLSLLELRARPEIAVVELGMNHTGEIRTLMGVAEADVRVWTNVGDAHLGFFQDADAIADAKAEILEHAGPSDTLIANADDARVMARASRFVGRLVTFAIEADATVRATDVELRGLDGSSAELRTPAGTVHVETPLLGAGNLANVVAATTIAWYFDVSLDEIAERARTLRAAHHRGELLRLAGGITIVDDSYNSSPAALKRALETIAAATGSARKVAVLGEMLELGQHATTLHEECGRAAAAAVDYVIAVGGAPARALAGAAIAAGMRRDSVVAVEAKEQAADAALARVRPGDLVLVKGSRAIGTDLVVDRLKAEFA